MATEPEEELADPWVKRAHETAYQELQDAMARYHAAMYVWQEDNAGGRPLPPSALLQVWLFHAQDLVKVGKAACRLMKRAERGDPQAQKEVLALAGEPEDPKNRKFDELVALHRLGEMKSHLNQNPDPYAQARAELDQLYEIGYIPLRADGTRFAPHEATGEDVAEAIKTIPCYSRETDPRHPDCQMCAVLLPCLQARLTGAPGAVAWSEPTEEQREDPEGPAA